MPVGFKIADLRDDGHFIGPLTSRLLMRTTLWWIAFVIVGLLLTSFATGASLQIFGLGLTFPGGGFLAHANFSSLVGLLHWAFMLAGLAVFVFSLFIWFATGNAFLPPLTWLALAFIASGMNHGGVSSQAVNSLMYLWLALSCALILAYIFCKFRALKQREILQNYLKELQKNRDDREHYFTSSRSIKPDLGYEKNLRFILNRALQDVDGFEGFNHLDQFQTAALRYQINLAGYGLSMAYKHKGKFLSDEVQNQLLIGQKNYIEKLRNKKVWGYWYWENMWGYASRNADPICRDNIMYSGFAALQIVMYHEASGKKEYNEEGSFALNQQNNATFSYHLDSLIDVLLENMERSYFTLSPCEPNWVYPLCNIISACAIKRHSPDKWDGQLAEKFRHILETEFITCDGKMIPCKSNYTGLSLPMIGGAMPQALPCFFLNALYPDLALRQWLILRHDILKDGKLNKRAFWRIDTGNYSFSRASAYTTTALAAAELGDDEVYELCIQALDEECSKIEENDYYYRKGVSIFSHALELCAASAIQNGFRHIISGEESE